MIVPSSYSMAFFQYRTLHMSLSFLGKHNLLYAAVVKPAFTVDDENYIPFLVAHHLCTMLSLGGRQDHSRGHSRFCNVVPKKGTAFPVLDIC